MPKIKWTVLMKNYGIYSNWNEDKKEIPELIKYTDQIPVQLDIEFGYILHIKKGRGAKIEFTMKHPPIEDENGNLLPDFTGEQYIRSNDYYFFLGDKAWAPIETKIGPWRLITKLDGELVADKTLHLLASAV